jgi:hypothetical protein
MADMQTDGFIASNAIGHERVEVRWATFLKEYKFG